jgi:hypothetical protein
MPSFPNFVKKVVFCISTFLLSATLSGAALLLNDSFSYSDGPLVTRERRRVGASQRFGRRSDGPVWPGVPE